MITGILAPMPEEIEFILQHMQTESIYESGQRKFYQGKIHEHDCVVALSRIGKVASGVTASVMIEKFGIDRLIVTGVAGAIAPHLKVGDLVVANECIQHDLDARPLFPQFEAPLLNKGFFECDDAMQKQALESCEYFLKHSFQSYIHKDDIKQFGLQDVKLYHGQICCGDQFIGTNEQLSKIREDLREVLAVEMEGGAVGQVCFEYGIPYVVIRSISDSANHEAHIDFNAYIQRVAKYYTWGIIDHFMKKF
jgi:adenosylhomocysteine nucleosidase